MGAGKLAVGAWESGDLDAGVRESSDLAVGVRGSFAAWAEECR
ncbi:hypothetical protein COJE103337_03625 [Corynebacterium jeikeium]|nr:hypothetical protein [Corynebacterium jeikeium]WCZ54085.1 hypothetical protein CJEIK_07940 [Corynebacterium jeikeium]SUY80609.1 Uncharacterised protein [Corynebacterium jeikeium]